MKSNNKVRKANIHPALFVFLIMLFVLLVIYGK
jgi:hypothetical protein